MIDGIRVMIYLLLMAVPLLMLIAAIPMFRENDKLWAEMLAKEKKQSHQNQ